MLEIKDLKKSYRENDISLIIDQFTITDGVQIGIIGETGSGKSTLLKCIAGLEQIDTGIIEFNGTKVLGPSEKLIPGHDQITIVKQDFDLDRFITVEQLLYHPYQNSLEEFQTIYKACDLEHLLDADTSELSGGEKQRVAIARALLRFPKILLFDEPFSNLDWNHKTQIKKVIDTIEKELSCTVLLVAHEYADVLSWAKEVMVMQGGKIIQRGNPEEIYLNPKNPYVAGLCGPYNLIYPQHWNINNTANYPSFGDQLIVRPERITSSDTNQIESLEAKIHSIKYMGNHDQLHVKTQHEDLVIYSDVKKYSIGDKVYLSMVS